MAVTLTYTHTWHAHTHTHRLKIDQSIPAPDINYMTHITSIGLEIEYFESDT